MRPLREDKGSADPRLAEAARLVSQVRPLGESAVRAQRVRRALDRKSGGVRRWRPAAALGLLALLGTSAAAALGVFNWLGTPEEDTYSVTAPFQGEVSSKKSSVEGQAAQPPGDDNQPEERNEGDPRLNDAALNEAPGKTSAQADLVGPPAAAKALASKRPPAGPATSRPKSPAPTLSEARLVQQAVEALRTSDDPDKADKLLAKYRQTSKSGTLDEEALALSIEVALAKKDARASDYAKQYLRAYPNGKFAQLARRALDQR